MDHAHRHPDSREEHVVASGTRSLSTVAARSALVGRAANDLFEAPVFPAGTEQCIDVRWVMLECTDGDAIKVYCSAIPLATLHAYRDECLAMLAREHVRHIEIPRRSLLRRIAEADAGAQWFSDGDEDLLYHLEVAGNTAITKWVGRIRWQVRDAQAP